VVYSRDIAGIGMAHDINHLKTMPALIFPDDHKAALVKPKQAFRSTRNAF